MYPFGKKYNILNVISFSKKADGKLATNVSDYQILLFKVSIISC